MGAPLMVTYAHTYVFITKLDTIAIIDVISLVGWPKLVKSPSRAALGDGFLYRSYTVTYPLALRIRSHLPYAH